MAPYIEEAKAVTEGSDVIPPKSINNENVHKSAVLHASLKAAPPKATVSQGCFITTGDGKQVLDASAGAAVACIGHNNQRVKDAIARQLDDVAYCYAPFFTTGPVEKLCKELCDSTGGKMSRVYIVSSGNIKLAK